MLILKKAQTNQLPVTVTSLTTLEDPKFLFCFYNIQSKEKFLVYLLKQNSSSRYDLFNLVLPTVLDLKTGSYKYYIYESEDDSTEIEGKKLLEVGYAKVAKTFPADIFYNAHKVNDINYVE